MYSSVLISPCLAARDGKCCSSADVKVIRTTKAVSLE